MRAKIDKREGKKKCWGVCVTLWLYMEAGWFFILQWAIIEWDSFEFAKESEPWCVVCVSRGGWRRPILNLDMRFRCWREIIKSTSLWNVANPGKTQIGQGVDGRHGQIRSVGKRVLHPWHVLWRRFFHGKVKAYCASFWSQISHVEFRGIFSSLGF